MEKKLLIDTPENKEYMHESALKLLDFGKDFASPGGGSYYLSDDGTPRKDRPRETWITCRMAHVYAIGAMMNVSGAGELSEAAVKGLLGELKDTRNGGWYSGIRADGSVLPDKMCYAHAFVMLAASSALLAGVEGAEELLKEAVATFDKYFWDEKEGLTFDTWDTDFKVLDGYRGINANMHTVEAYLAVADATGDDLYRERAGRIVKRVVKWAEDNDHRIPEHFNSNWEPQFELNKENPADPFKPYGATPGHGIEWSRLILQWAVSVFKEGGELKRYTDVSERLYKRAIGDAWNVDGAEGLVYTTDFKGQPVIHDRMHWTLAEAINTSAVLYRATGEGRYADDYAMFLEYLERCVLDRKNGSWFHQLDKDNKVLDTVWPGKPDVYHAFQAMLIPYSDVGVSIASAVKRR